MKVSRLVNKILENWPIKILCIVAATFLYLFNRISTVEKKTFSVPLEIVQNGLVMQTGPVKKNVTVTVRTNNDDNIAVHANQILATLNLDSISESGTYTIPVNVEVDQQLLDVDPLEIRVKPEFVEVKVERRDFKFVPLEVSFVGEPEYGYFVSEYSIEPNSVEIIGPKSILDEMNELHTERIDLTNTKKSLDIQTKIRNINNMISITEGSSCNVKVKIEPVPLERQFDGIQVYFNRIPAAFDIVSESPKVSLKLKGTVPTLEHYVLSSMTVQADLGIITEEGEYELPLKYVIPQQFTLLEKSAETVTVRVKAKPTDSEAETESAE